MIGRWGTTETAATHSDDGRDEPKGFDAFEVTLGDTMRGERATLGKSLLDVQRELKIKAAYISAIENSDTSAFDTPGFIAGFVRSYARYLELDPDWAFERFCQESGYTPMNGMAAGMVSASARKRDEAGGDPIVAPSVPFIPETAGLLASVDPRAVGSSLVLLALIGGIGFGGWSVLQEVQRVQFAPVEQSPAVASAIDPLQSAPDPQVTMSAAADGFEGFDAPPSTEALSRLYRPEALAAPVMVARDQPISTLDPRTNGVFATGGPRLDAPPVIETAAATPDEVPEAEVQVVEAPRPGVRIAALRDSWMSVRAADGTELFGKILAAGETYEVPDLEEPPMIRTAGMSGWLYFEIGGEMYGPAGNGTELAKRVTLSTDALKERYAVARIEGNEELRDFMVAQAALPEAVEAAE
ncbi:MAG: RodZ domain-containing protein [Shimia sp.]